MIVCPRCDGNGFIYEAYIGPLSVTVYICDECDALWKDGHNICLDNFQDFTTYLRKQGYSYIDAPLEDINYEWHKKLIGSIR